MGAWGTSLYANDAACDIRSDYLDGLRHGKTNEEVTQKLIDSNQEIMKNDEEEPLFWFALADTQWNYGRLLPEVKKKALFFLSQEKELERWNDSERTQVNAWVKTLKTLKDKLNSPQPVEKKVSKYRLYQCQWKLGDVFAYQFSEGYSAEKGVKGKYIIFRKISEDTWWPGHIVPVIQVYKWIGCIIPSIEELSGLELLPICQPTGPVKTPNNKQNYEIKLITESEKSIPKSNLMFLGNLPGDDIIPFRGHDFWTGYYPVGWESSKYNRKLEHFIIDMFLSY